MNCNSFLFVAIDIFLVNLILEDSILVFKFSKFSIFIFLYHFQDFLGCKYFKFYYFHKYFWEVIYLWKMKQEFTIFHYSIKYITFLAKRYHYQMLFLRNRKKKFKCDQWIDIDKYLLKIFWVSVNIFHHLIVLIFMKFI